MRQLALQRENPLAVRQLGITRYIAVLVSGGSETWQHQSSTTI